MGSGKNDPPKTTQTELTATQERVRLLERELQACRLELEEKELRLNTVLHDISLQQSQSESLVARDVHAKLEKLFEELAGPIAQLATLNHLLIEQGRTLQAKDVLVIANTFVACLKTYGLEIEGTIAERVPFDSSVHEPLSLEESIKHGETVIVRMIGISHQGRLLRRAAVTKQPVAE